MPELTDSKNSFIEESEISKLQVENIMNLVGYSFDLELSKIAKPEILILGSGPYLSEAKLLEEWSVKKEKSIKVTCVDMDPPDEKYAELMLNLKNSEYFNMKTVKSDSNYFDYEPDKYDLVLLLRAKKLAIFDSNVFNHVRESLKRNGVYIMSGGLPERYNIELLNKEDMKLERTRVIPDYVPDVWNSYFGENTIAKFRKY